MLQEKDVGSNIHQLGQCLLTEAKDLANQMSLTCFK